MSSEGDDAGGNGDEARLRTVQSALQEGTASLMRHRQKVGSFLPPLFVLPSLPLYPPRCRHRHALTLSGNAKMLSGLLEEGIDVSVVDQQGMSL